MYVMLDSQLHCMCLWILHLYRCVLLLWIWEIK